MSRSTTASFSAQSKAPPQKRILCVGKCVLDIIHVCESFPKENTDIHSLTGYWQRGGNASNICTVLRQLEAECEFLGMISEAPEFRFLMEDCRKRGIIFEHCPYTAQDPPFSSVILSKESNTRTIAVSKPNFHTISHSDFRRIDINTYSWIHFEACNLSELKFMINDIREYNQKSSSKVIISIELEKKDQELLVLAAMADFVFMGSEFSKFSGWESSHDACYGLREVLKKMFDQKPAIICTWGLVGACCLDANDNYKHLPATPPKKIEDTLGAGDTFLAATIYALSLLKLDLPRAVAFANEVAGYKIGEIGYDTIGKFMETYVCSGQKDEN